MNNSIYVARRWTEDQRGASRGKAVFLCVESVDILNQLVTLKEIEEYFEHWIIMESALQSFLMGK